MHLILQIVSIDDVDEGPRHEPFNGILIMTFMTARSIDSYPDLIYGESTFSTSAFQPILR